MLCLSMASAPIGMALLKIWPGLAKRLRAHVEGSLRGERHARRVGIAALAALPRALLCLT